MQMHWILRGAAKQEAQLSPVTHSREDSTFGDLPTVGSVHISCNVSTSNSCKGYIVAPACDRGFNLYTAGG